MLRRSLLAAPALGLALASPLLTACWLFKSSTETTQPQAAAAPATRTFADKVDALKAAGWPLDGTLEFLAEASAAVERGKLSATNKRDESEWVAIRKGVEEAVTIHTDPEAASAFNRAWAELYARGDFDADVPLRNALAAKADAGLFTLVSSSIFEDYDEVRIEICKAVRPTLEDNKELDRRYFLDRCREWAEDDVKKLWAGAAKDYAWLKKEDAREEAEYRRFRAVQEEIAAIFLRGGECIGSDCDRFGWKSFGEDAGAETRCVNNLCFDVGWQTSTAKGSYNTRCVKEDCTEFGWKTTGPGGTWVATCKEGDCLGVGYTVKRGGKRYDVTVEKAGTVLKVKAPDGTDIVCENHGGYDCDLAD
ncbi:MAG: hypothetical protein R3B09_05865 [Nannocystaceae bacterium]